LIINSFECEHHLYKLEFKVITKIFIFIPNDFSSYYGVGKNMEQKRK
jgi:hypothetical protein